MSPELYFAVMLITNPQKARRILIAEDWENWFMDMFDEEYKDIFGNAEHKLEFYNTSEENEYRINIDEVNEYGRVGVLLMLDMKKPGNRTLLKRALEFDCGLLETEYEIVSE